MINLTNLPELGFKCPECEVKMDTQDWKISGMLSLAEMVCPQCNQHFFGSLPTGFGQWYPALLNPDSGKVHSIKSNPGGIEWYLDIFRNFTNRREQELKFTINRQGSISQPILINCIDRAYGHVIVKLLNIQYYLDNYPEHDLIVLVPKYLSWLVPDGVDMIWSVNISLNQGDVWNEWLSGAIYDRLSDFDELYLGKTNVQPHPDEFDIERYSGVRPLQLEDWNDRPDTPTVTFIWRGDSDRLWYPTISENRLQLRGYIDEGVSKLTSGTPLVSDQLSTRKRRQTHRVEKLAKKLKNEFPNLDFAVAGMGEPGGFPKWITDLRFPNPSSEQERVLCQRYSNSHVIVGVHGSHMLLPYAHSGSVIQLITKSRLNALMTNIISPRKEVGEREMMFRYHWLPTSVGPDVVYNYTERILKDRSKKKVQFGDKWSKHRDSTRFVQFDES